MADSSFGERDIFIDLATATARVIRSANDGAIGLIGAIDISGVTGASAGTIILRKESATGPVIFQQYAPSASTIDTHVTFHCPIGGKGLYMDAMSGAWDGNSTMVIHTK